jgi:hypothetical protein
MKKLFIFLAGFVTGVIAVNLYELFGVPATPNEDYHEWTEDELLRMDKLFTPDEIEALASVLVNEEMKAIASMDDTQPIYIGEPEQEVTAYELYIWSGESE